MEEEKRGGFTISSELSKNTNETATEEAITGILVLEQRPVIPPALVGTVQVQVGAILGELEFDPFTFRVTLSMEFSKHGLGLFALVVDVEPAR